MIFTVGSVMPHLIKLLHKPIKDHRMQVMTSKVLIETRNPKISVHFCSLRWQIRMAGHKKFYVVFVRRNPGIYEIWHECSQQTYKFRGAVFKGFRSWDEAHNVWVRHTIRVNQLLTQSPKAIEEDESPRLLGNDEGTSSTNTHQVMTRTSLHFASFIVGVVFGAVFVFIVINL